MEMPTLWTSKSGNRHFYSPSHISPALPWYTIMGMAQDILCAIWGTVTIKTHYNCNGEIINKPKSWFYLGLQSHCRAWSQANVFPALSCVPYYLRAWNRLLLRGNKISERVNRIQTMVARIHPIINVLVLS